MKKLIMLGVLGLLVPVISFASIDQSLSYGSRGPEVIELQEFLVANSYLSTPATGNFYSLTLRAVKAYQADHNIATTGYVGNLTRASINSELELSLASSSPEEGTTTPPVQTSNDDLLKQIITLQQQAMTPNQNLQSQSNPINQPVVASVPTPAPLPPFNFQVFHPAVDQIRIDSSVDIDLSSVVVMSGDTTISPTKNEKWTSPAGNVFCENINDGKSKLCTADNTFFNHTFTFDQDVSDYAVQFKTLDGRTN